MVVSVLLLTCVCKATTAAAAVTCAADFREKSENYYRFR